MDKEPDTEWEFGATLRDFVGDDLTSEEEAHYRREAAAIIPFDESSSEDEYVQEFYREILARTAMELWEMEHEGSENRGIPGGETDRLQGLIETAFLGVSCHGEKRLLLSGEAEDGDMPEEGLDFLATVEERDDWRRIPPALLSCCQWCMGYLGPEAFRFLLPAFMCASLRHPELRMLGHLGFFLHDTADARFSLFSKAQLETVHEFRRIPDRLVCAIDSGHAEEVDALLQEEGYVPALLSRGKLPPIQTCWGTLLQSLANMEGSTPEMARLLLDLGQDVNAIAPEDGRTPLMLAVLSGNLPLVRFLLENGADVSPADTEDGATALHLAADRASAECVELLLQYGADANAREHDGMTPLDWAVHYHREDVVEILRAHGAIENFDIYTFVD